VGSTMTRALAAACAAVMGLVLVIAAATGALLNAATHLAAPTSTGSSATTEPGPPDQTDNNAAGAPGSTGGSPGGSDIPAPLLPLYRQAAASCPGLDWSVLAAIGKIESDHGRSSLPGVHSGGNAAAGAMVISRWSTP